MQRFVWIFGLVLFSVAIFYKFFLQGLLPIPGDILIGAYYPWLDYKWGFEVGVPIKNPMASDVISLLYPWRTIAISIIKSGQLPLWDQTALLGQPLLANFQAAVLNPLNFLFFLMADKWAWSIQVGLQPILISIAMFIFLRNKNLSPLASFFGAVTFAYSGFSIVWMEYNTIGYTLLFVPLILFFIDKLLANLEFRYVYFLALVICLQIFSGYPQISIYTLLFSSFYFLYQAIQTRQPLGKYLYFGLANILGVLFASVQLLPSVELMNASIRSFDNTAIAGDIQFLPLKHFITLFVPDFFGNPATGNYFSIGSYDNFALYILSPALIFVTFFCLNRKLIKKNFFWILALEISIIIATDSFISKTLASSNILGLKSAVAARILFIFDFALAVISAYGLDDYFQKKPRLIHQIIPLAIYIGILIGVLVSIFILQSSPFIDLAKLNQAGQDSLRQSISLVNISLRNLIIPFAAVLVLTISLLINKRPLIYSTIILSLLVLSFYSTNKYLTFIKGDLLYPPTEELTELKKVTADEYRFDREQAELLPSNTWIPYGLNAVSGQNALAILDSNNYLGLVNNTLDLPSRFVDIKDINSPLYDTLNIQYLSVLNRKEKDSVPDRNGLPYKQFRSEKFREYKNFATTRILENTTNLGIGWFSDSTECIADKETTKRLLLEQGYDPRKISYANCERSVSTENNYKVNLEEKKNNYLKIAAFTQKENYLILSLANYPGWKAFIDNQETKLFTANTALMSVLVPRGEHTVELKYQPLSFMLGLVISLGSFIIASSLLVFIYLRRLGNEK